MKTITRVENLIIPKTNETPEINFNAVTGVLRFSGRSYAGSVTTFFKQLDTWLDEYLKHPAKLTTIELQPDYLNSVSNKLLFSFIQRCKLSIQGGNELVIKWYHYEGDTDSIERAELISKILHFPVETIEME